MAVHATRDLSDAEKSWDRRRPIAIDRHTTVLEMKGRVNQERGLGRIVPTLFRQFDDTDKLALEDSRLLSCQEGRVEENAPMTFSSNDATSLFAFAYDGGGNMIARLELVYEALTEAVDEDGPG